MTTIPRVTTVPAVTDAFIAGLQAAVDSTTVEIQDGPKPKALKSKVIAVGVGNESFTHRMTPDERMGGGYLKNEQFQIVCSLWSWGGNKASMSARRQDCADLLEQVRQVAASLTASLDAVYMDLGPDLSWLQSYTGEAAACSVGFTVEVSAGI